MPKGVENDKRVSVFIRAHLRLKLSSNFHSTYRCDLVNLLVLWL